jgi:NADH:ubiquinone oxidoreductase subunit 5 (subunit L)/multisubunit Na+/H+ antiporter MnhA subunit
VLAVPGLALIGGLALACFAKVAGVVFLGVPRAADAEAGHEAGPALLAPMIALAGGCLVIGLAPFAIVPGLVRAAADVAGLPGGEGGAALDAAMAGAHAVTRAAVVLLGVTLGWWAVSRWIERGHRAPVPRETWACGFEDVTPRMQYTASSFAAPIISLAGASAGVHRERGDRALATHPRELVLEGLVEPGWRRIQTLASRLRPMHHGRLHTYLAYLIGVLATLLIYLWVRQP